ncbi:MAG: hypothetical protein ABI200_05220, partial [Gaiellales bacterium]
MHNHFTDMFNGTDAGVRHDVRAMRVMMHDGGGGGAARPALHNRDIKVDGTTKSVPVTASEIAREAIKDGKISSKEKTAFDKSPAVREAVKSEQTRLTDAVRTTNSSQHARGEDGKLVMRNGKPIPVGVSMMPTTDHEKGVWELGSTKGKVNLDVLDSQIAKLEKSGSTVGLDSLKQQRSARASDENKVANVIEKKESLVGALELEKIEIQKGLPKGAADDHRALRTDAVKWIEQLNENDGQVHGGKTLGMFGDAWDAKQTSFDDLAKKFHDKPELLADFAKVQGRKDG